MYKKTVSGIMAVLLAVTLAACGAAPSASGGTQSEPAESGNSDVIEIEFFNMQSEEAIIAATDRVIEQFNAENPDIKIVQNAVPDPKKVLLSRIATNDIPPLFTDWPTQLQFKEKIANGYIEPLTGEAFLEGINPSYVELATGEDGNCYAMPYTQNFMGICYNIDIFEAENIEIPKTFDELLDVCETLKSKGIDPIYFPLKDWGPEHQFQTMSIGLVPTAVDDLMAAVNGTATLSENEDWKKLGEDMITLLNYGNEDAAGMSVNMQQEAFANGKCAMIITGSYAQGNIRVANPDINFGMFPFPGYTEETTTAISGLDTCYCIAASATDEEKEACKRFLAFMAQPEIAQQWSNDCGLPSVIEGTTYSGETHKPMMDFLASGQTHDWMGSTIPQNVTTEINNTNQGFMIDRYDVSEWLANLDQAIQVAAAQ